MKYLNRSSLSVICLFLVGLTYAQGDIKPLKNKQHSLELAYGTPSIVAYLETPANSGDNEIYYMKGQKVEDVYHHPNINLSYVYSWAERWDLVTLANIHLISYKVMQYPEKEGYVPPEGSYQMEYDWTQEPALLRQERQIKGSLTFAVRYHWLLREQVSCYSALGISLWVFPLPYITPIGVRFGKGRIYGIVEANISAANMIGMAGLGVRL